MTRISNTSTSLYKAIGQEFTEEEFQQILGELKREHKANANEKKQDRPGNSKKKRKTNVKSNVVGKLQNLFGKRKYQNKKSRSADDVDSVTRERLPSIDEALSCPYPAGITSVSLSLSSSNRLNSQRSGRRCRRKHHKGRKRIIKKIVVTENNI